MNNLRRTFFSAAVGTCVYATLSGLVHATPIDMSIRSGSGWLATTDPGAGSDWTTAGFNDDTWISAYAPYPNDVVTPDDIRPGTLAEFMWYWDSEVPPTGWNGPETAYFRYNFFLDPAFDIPIAAQAAVIADDVFQMYVNGHFVAMEDLDGNQDENGIPIFRLVDFTQWLLPGDNVIAIQAWDGNIADGAFDRGYELVFFDGRIRSIPEPGSLSLLALGIALTAFRRVMIETFARLTKRAIPRKLTFPMLA